MNGYDLTRKWFDFALSNPDKVSSSHTALYLWTIELNNRLGWVEKFGLTVREAMDGMSCKSRNTYLKCFHDLIEWKFLELVKKSQNQYQCNIIALLNFEQPKSKRLFKNSTTTDTSTDTTTGTITDTIPKTYKRNKHNKHKNIPDLKSGGNKKSELIKKESALFTRMVSVWYEEIHSDWQFEKMDGVKVNSLIKKITKLFESHNRETSDDSIVDFFRLMCLNLPKFYEDKALRIIDSDFNTIMEQLKKLKNGQSRTTTAKQAIIDEVDAAFN